MTTHHLTILILGGYGTFGGRLAELLRDEASLTLIIAGRSLSKAEAFCAQLHGAARKVPKRIDRNSDLTQHFHRLKPDAVVDASGPFQAYGEHPYRVVEAAIECGVHYFDLADGSDFVRGIVAYDDLAKSKDVTILSGVSSFPVLTAAVVRHLSEDLTKIKTITAGIAPSPYAGVGLNVIRAIAAYTGKKITLRRNGQTDYGYGLTETVRYTVAVPGYTPLESIDFSLVDVPDLQLLSDLWPEVDTVWVGAGPVPASLHRLLRGFARLVKWGLIPSLVPMAKLMHWAINTLAWGEHRGGMFVEIQGYTANNSLEKRSWHMLAEGDDGPLIPSMAIAAIIQKWLKQDVPIIGARAATAELELLDYQPLFESRTIVSGNRTQTQNPISLYQHALQNELWSALPPSLQHMHSTIHVAHGKADVTRGTSMLAKLVARVFGFPEAGKDLDVNVQFERTAERERWQRNFAGKTFYSDQFHGRGRYQHLLCEKFGPFVFGMALIVENQRLRLLVRKWNIFGMPLPRFLLPRGDFYEYETNGRFNFHVAIKAPLIGPIVTYQGYLER